MYIKYKCNARNSYIMIFNSVRLKEINIDILCFCTSYSVTLSAFSLCLNTIAASRNINDWWLSYWISHTKTDGVNSTYSNFTLADEITKHFYRLVPVKYMFCTFSQGNCVTCTIISLLIGCMSCII